MIKQDLKIVSGGQTGVDQGALEAALGLGLVWGGWVPASSPAPASSSPRYWAGCWRNEGWIVMSEFREDDRSAAEIIAEIEGARR